VGVSLSQGAILFDLARHGIQATRTQCRNQAVSKLCRQEGYEERQMISLEIQAYPHSSLFVSLVRIGEIDKTTYYSVEVKHQTLWKDNPLLT
jgi:hypothetical protein